MSARPSGRAAGHSGCVISGARRAGWPLPPTEHCRQCLSDDVDWRQGSGRGEIYSWTVVYRPVTAEFEPPYAPAIVTLDEGYQMLTNIVGVPPEDIEVGLRVRVQFHDAGPDVTLPYFTAEGTDSS